jgi:peptide chain release factor subunit 1
VSAITAEVVRELADFDPKGSLVTTCYLNVDGRERVRPVDYERDLERLVRRLKSSGAMNGAVSDDVDRITDHVRNGLDRKSVRGIAIFSCLARHLWTVVSLPVPVHSRLHVGPAPAIGQLASVAEQLQSIGVILVDRQRTRILVFEGGQLIDHTESVDELPRDYDERGHAARGDVSNHVDELAHQHLRQAARDAFAVFKDRRVGRVTLGGPHEAVTELEEHLHPYLKERLVDRLKLGVTAGLDEVRHAMLDIEARTERAEEAAAVAHLRDAVGSGAKGVAGLADTLEALRQRRVDLLLVSEGYEDTGWRCTTCQVLAAVGPRCASCGTEMEHLDDVVDEAVQEAMHQSCRIEMCVENADLDVLGRIGALLRF